MPFLIPIAIGVGAFALGSALAKRSRPKLPPQPPPAAVRTGVTTPVGAQEASSRRRARGGGRSIFGGLLFQDPLIQTQQLGGG